MLKKLMVKDKQTYIFLLLIIVGLWATYESYLRGDILTAIFCSFSAGANIFSLFYLKLIKSNQGLVKRLMETSTHDLDLMKSLMADNISLRIKFNNLKNKVEGSDK